MNENIAIAIKTMLNSDRFHSCYIWGETSVGKTYTIEQILGDKAKFVTTHITPLSLYIYLYENKDQIIVFDDLDKLDDSIISILKAALWSVNGKRTLNWHTSSNILFQRGIPNEFEFTGKIVLTCNDENQHRKFEPLLARMFVVNHELTKEQFIEICKKIFENYGIAEFDRFKHKFINVAVDNLHLRNVLKYCEYTKNGFTDQADAIFTINEHFKFLDEWVSQVSQVSSVCFEFLRKFGVSRATFFRVWKKYNNKKNKGW